MVIICPNTGLAKGDRCVCASSAGGKDEFWGPSRAVLVQSSWTGRINRGRLVLLCPGAASSRETFTGPLLS